MASWFRVSARVAQTCLALISTLTVVANADQNCPTTTLYCCGATHVVKDPQSQLSCNNSSGSGGAQYDLTLGSLGASCGGWSANSSVAAQDDYLISGLPDGTPLSFKARMEVSLSQCSLCDGFRQDVTTAVARMSWGRLKMRYH